MSKTKDLVIEGNYRITTFRQGHFTMVLVEMLDETGKRGIGFSKYNPEDADRHQIDARGKHIYELKVVKTKRRTGKIKKTVMKIACKKKPFLYNPETGYRIALTRAIRDMDKIEGQGIINIAEHLDQITFKSATVTSYEAKSAGNFAADENCAG